MKYQQGDVLLETIAKDSTFEKIKDGVPVKEISNLLGITESGVYVYKNRVVDKLKVEIKRLRQELD